MKNTMNTQENLREKKIKFLFNTFMMSSAVVFVTAFGFALLVLVNGNEVFRNFIFNFFKQIPVVGQGLHLLLKSLNLVDLKMIYTQLILPLLSLELLYYSFFLILFQIIILISMVKFKKNSKNYFSFLLIIIITSVMILVKQVNLIILPIAQGSALTSRNIFISILLLIQLLTTLCIAYNYHKLKMFDLKEVLNSRTSHRMIRIGSITVMCVLILFSSVLFIANTQVDHAKEIIAVDYVLDFKPAADGAVHVELPDKLLTTSKLFGFKLPKTIEGGQILQYFAVSEVNIGQVVSQFALDFVDNLAYLYLIVPMTNAIATVILLALILIYDWKKKHIPFSALAVEGGQFILSLILSIFFISKFGIILSIFGSFILVASFINLYSEFTKTKYYNHLIELKEKKSLA